MLISTKTLQLNVTVNNMGVLDANNVAATLTTSDTNIIITDGSHLFETIPAGHFSHRVQRIYAFG